MPSTKKQTTRVRKRPETNENIHPAPAHVKKTEAKPAKKKRTNEKKKPQRLDKNTSKQLIKTLYTQTIGSTGIDIDAFDKKAREEMTEHMSLVAAEIMGMSEFDTVADPNKARRHVMYGVASKILKLTVMSELPPIVYDIAREAFKSTNFVGLRDGAVRFKSAE